MSPKVLRKGDEKVEINPEIDLEIEGDKMTTLSLPQSIKDEIIARQLHRREPQYEVLKRLLVATKRKPAHKG